MRPQLYISVFYLQVKSLIPIKHLPVLALYDLSELLNEIILFRKPNKPLNSSAVSNRASTCSGKHPSYGDFGYE